MAQSFSNAFPIESIGRDIARNNYNYESIFNALMEWNNSEKDYLTVRLMKNSAPYFHTWTIPTKKAQAKTASISLVTPVASKAFDLDGEYGMVAATDATDEGKDDVVIRLNVVNNGGTRWRAFIDTFIFDSKEAAETIPYAIYRNAETEGYSLYVVDSAKTSTEDAQTSLMISEYSSATVKQKNHVVINDGSVYVMTTGNGTELLYLTDLGTQNAVYLGSVWESGKSYNKGDLVVQKDESENYHLFVNLADDNANLSDPADYLGTLIATDVPTKKTAETVTFTVESYNSETFTATGTIVAPDDFTKDSYTVGTGLVLAPSTEEGKWTLTYSEDPSDEPSGDISFSNVDYTVHSTEYGYSEYAGEDQLWKEIVLLPISNEFSASSVVRMKPDNDFMGIVLQNVGSDYADIGVNIGVEGNAKYKMPDSTYARRVGVFNTANYSMFPYSTADAWVEGKTCEYDPSVPITERQSYSASMIFDHSAEDVSTVNYINYDGPDLDQGLCIYLPVHGKSDDGTGENTPEDGYTFDFFFRIWPTPAYNGQSTNDLIINKAQIYVYSVDDADEAKSGSCTLNPLAKFSMARLTNFYVYDENIGVPNRPVMYRASFVYSAKDGKWKLFDYYQLPDHVFIGPVGFVDPTNKGIMDDTRPGNEYKGYETAGFPMFADPFEKTSLEPVSE